MSSLQKQIELMVNEQVKKMIAEAVSPIVEEVRSQWGVVVSELVSARKNREQLDVDLRLLIQKIDDLSKLFSDWMVKQAEVRKLERETLAKLNKYLDRW